jgi:phage gp29-like protein
MMTMIDRLKAALSAFKGGAQKEMQTTQTALLARLHNAYIASLTGGLTPRRLEAILRAADAGDIVGQHTLFAEIEDRDEHIHAELSKRRRALLSIPWRIEPGKAGGKRAEAVAGAVREQVEAIPDFEDVILDMADAIGHGFACLEIEWAFDGAKHLPAALHHRPQNWLMLADDLATLRLRDDTPEGQELWPLGWIVHKHRSKSGLFARAGLFRVLCWTYLLKQYCRGDFSQFLEIHGLPMRLGKYPANTSEEEQKTLLTALQALGSDAAGIIPEGMGIEFKEAARGSEKPFVAMHELCETGQSKAILGSTLTTDTKGVGSQALGEIHNEVRLDILASDARQIAGSLTRQLLAPLAFLNEGAADPALLPRFVFDPSRPEDLEKLAKSLPELATVMDIPTRWAHDRAGIPMPEDGEPVLRRKTEVTKNDSASAEATAALAAEDGDDPRFPDQEAVDAATVPDSTLTALARDLLAPVFAEAENGVAPEALLGKLAELYPKMDTTALEELTARVLFVGELWGRLSAQEEKEA